jgi:two-component system, NtrC family, response regulator
MARILIIDDGDGTPVALQAALQNAGHTAEIATGAEEGIIRAAGQRFDVVILSVPRDRTHNNCGEEKSLESVEQLHRVNPGLPVILMTDCRSTDTITDAIINATKRGAYDYVTKPRTAREMEELVKVVRDAATSQQFHKPAQVSRAAAAPLGIRGKSRAMQAVLKEIGRVAAKPATVLIRGETGTGKELVARALHEHGDRAGEPFIIVNCAAIPDSLLESELFGHEQGAFTDATTRRIGRFEQASGGTIFLDEVGDISRSTQTKLLRVLQDKTIQRVGGKESFQVDVRVIAATHRDLESAVEERRFRLDLYYRLNDAVICLPPLRDRREDIPELANFFLQQHAAELGATGSTFDSEAIDHLQSQPWPGNVRELRNAVRKALLLARGHRIDLAIIRKVLAQARPNQGVPTRTGGTSLEQSLAVYVSRLLDEAENGEREDVAAVLTEWVEREIYGQAIRLAEGQQSKAAKWLGVSRPTIREKLSRYSLRASTERGWTQPIA